MNYDVVFTNGCFDILHDGHLELLSTAKQLGYKLVVGLNSDESVKKLKGPDRPYNNQQIRKKNLEEIVHVDEVIIFDEETPYELIKELQPGLIVKGGDYLPDDVVGKDIAPVYIMPLVGEHSTTKIIEEMHKKSSFWKKNKIDVRTK